MRFPKEWRTASVHRECVFPPSPSLSLSLSLLSASRDSYSLLLLLSLSVFVFLLNGLVRLSRSDQRLPRMDRERHRWKLSCCVWLSVETRLERVSHSSRRTWRGHCIARLSCRARCDIPGWKALLDTRQISRKWSHEGPRAEGKNGLLGEGRINRLVPLHREEISEEGKSIVLWRVNAREIFTKPLTASHLYYNHATHCVTARVTASRVIFLFFSF